VGRRAGVRVKVAESISPAVIGSAGARKTPLINTSSRPLDNLRPRAADRSRPRAYASAACSAFIIVRALYFSPRRFLLYGKPRIWSSGVQTVFLASWSAKWKIPTSATSHLYTHHRHHCRYAPNLLTGGGSTVPTAPLLPTYLGIFFHSY